MSRFDERLRRPDGQPQVYHFHDREGTPWTLHAEAGARVLFPRELRQPIEPGEVIVARGASKLYGGFDPAEV
jgi:hypothetical protein